MSGAIKAIVKVYRGQAVSADELAACERTKMTKRGKLTDKGRRFAQAQIHALHKCARMRRRLSDHDAQAFQATLPYRDD